MWLTQRHLFGYFNLTHLQTATLCISCCLSLSLKLILVPLRQDKLILGKEESESHCRMEPGFVRPRAAVTTSGNGNNDNNDNVTSSDIVTTSGSDNKNLNSSDTHIDHFRPDEVCLERRERRLDGRQDLPDSADRHL